MKEQYKNNDLFKLLARIELEEQRDILAIINNLVSTNNDFDRKFFEYQLELTSLKRSDTNQLLIQKNNIKENYTLILLEDMSIEGEKYLNLLLEYLKQVYYNSDKIEGIIEKLSYSKHIKDSFAKYIKSFLKATDTKVDRQIIKKELLSHSMKPNTKNNWKSLHKKVAFSAEDGNYGIKYLSGSNNKRIHVFVNGFTNDECIGRYIDWTEESRDILDEDDILYGYDWPSGKEIKKHILTVLEKIVTSSNIPHAIGDLAFSSISEWKQARDNSRDYSEGLATFIENELIDNPNIEINLYGHSLGANILHYTLKHLYEKKLKVNEVYLFGGASEINKAAWTESLCVANKIYNYYSKNDLTLTYLFQSMELCNPIGLNPIIYNQKSSLDLATLYNYNVSEDISGHTKYIPNFNILYRWKYR